MKPSRGLKEERKGRRLSLLSFSLCATVCLSTCQSLNVACRSSSCTNWSFFRRHFWQCRVKPCLKQWSPQVLSLLKPSTILNHLSVCLLHNKSFFKPKERLTFNAKNTQENNFNFFMTKSFIVLQGGRVLAAARLTTTRDKRVTSYRHL